MEGNEGFLKQESYWQLRMEKSAHTSTPKLEPYVEGHGVVPKHSDQSIGEGNSGPSLQLLVWRFSLQFSWVTPKNGKYKNTCTGSAESVPLHPSWILKQSFKIWYNCQFKTIFTVKFRFTFVWIHLPLGLDFFYVFYILNIVK